MNPTPSVAAEAVHVRAPRRSDPARFLYSGFAALLVVVMLLGFQQFYLHGRAYPSHPLAPPVKALIITHGVAMTSWVLLFLLQPLLIATRHRNLHMTIGWLGTAIAASIVVVGLRLPVQTTRYEPDIVLWGLHRRAFMAIPFGAVLLFTGFVGLAIWQRSRPKIHRPMMLLGTLAVMAAAADRITGLPDLYATTVFGTLFGPFFAPLVIGALFLVAKWALTRRFDRWFAGGYVVLVAGCAATMRIAFTAPWDHFTAWLMR